MKKSKLLIPFISLSIITPTITMVGCNNKTVKKDLIWNSDTNYFITSGSINIEAGKTYIFSFTPADAKQASMKYFDLYYSYTASYKVSDTIKLKVGDKQEQTITGQQQDDFWYFVFDGCLEVGKKTTITFKANTNANNCYPVVDADPE